MGPITFRFNVSRCRLAVGEAVSGLVAVYRVDLRLLLGPL
jgi:hypothetical protein